MEVGRRGVALTLLIGGLVVIGGLVAMAAPPAPGVLPAATGGHGCTARYWLEHTTNWPTAGVTAAGETDTIHPDDPVSKYFYTDPAVPQADDTLLQALRYDDGTDSEGVRRTLVREAVTAMINAADDRFDYAFRRPEFVAQVREVLTSGDPGVMSTLARQLATLNGSGCPLG